MKKILMGLVLSVFCLGSMSFAQFETESNTIPEAREGISPEELQDMLDLVEEEFPETGRPVPLCDFSDRQLASIQTASDIIVQQGHEKITMNHFSTPAYQELIDIYNDEMVMTIESILELCRDGLYPDTYMYIPTTMTEAMDMIAEYVQTILTLKEFEKGLGGTDVVMMGIDALRDQVLSDEFVDMRSRNAKTQSMTTVEMMMTMKDIYTDTTVNMNIDMDKQGTINGDLTQTNIEVLGGYEMDAGEEMSVDVSGLLELDLRIVDGSIYIGLIDADIDMSDLSIPNDPEIDQMLAMMQLMKGKYIQIPLDDMIGYDVMMDPQLLFSQINTGMYDMMMADWMMTYYTQDGVSYAGLNPVACASMTMFGSVYDCLSEVMSQLEYPEDLIPIVYNNGTWSISEDDASFVWNESEIVSFDMQISDGGDAGYILYKNNVLAVDIATIGWDDSTGYIRADGILSSENIDISGSFTDTWTAGTFGVKGSVSLTDIDLAVEFEMNDATGECVDCGMKFSFDILTNTTEVDTLDISAPSDDLIVDMSMFM